MAPKSENPPIREGQFLAGPQFSEPMQVETVRPNGPGSWIAGLVGTQTERFRRVALSAQDIADLTVTDSTLSFLEIHDLSAYLKRKQSPTAAATDWKHPPAGLG